MKILKTVLLTFVAIYSIGLIYHTLTTVNDISISLGIYKSTIEIINSY